MNFSRNLSPGVGKRLSCFIGVAVMVAVCSEPTLDAQDPSPGAAQETRIVLGSDSNEPGLPVVIPIYFSPAAEAQVASLRIAIFFDNRKLTFISFQKGISLEVSNAEVTAEVTNKEERAGVERSTLTINASLPPTAGSTDGIPSGVLGYMTLQIHPGAAAGAVPVTITAEALAAGNREAVPDVVGTGTEVVIRELGSTPNVICFFFSH